MKRRATTKDWLPLARAEKGAAELPTGAAFRPEWIDFDRGIRVGNLEPHERITRILKFQLESRYGTGFVTDRWGRGVYWQWICWVPRADREAKPVSSGTNFGCAKFYITQDREARVFECGLAVERGYTSGKPAMPGILLQPDWDWNRLMTNCARGTTLDRELHRLVHREGFTVSVLSENGPRFFTRKNFTSARQVRDAARRAPGDSWAGFNVYYPMTEAEISASSGYDVIQGILGAFAEVLPVMNLVMQVSLSGPGSGTPSGKGKAERQSP
jgi:hypothetical protein